MTRSGGAQPAGGARRAEAAGAGSARAAGAEADGAERAESRHAAEVDSAAVRPEDAQAAAAERTSVRDLVRRRRRDYRAADTGRHHHMGTAPALQPVLGEGTTETAPVQLAQRTRAQLEQARARYAERMAAAAAALDFEQAARLRDAVHAVETELRRRGSD